MRRGKAEAGTGEFRRVEGSRSLPLRRAEDQEKERPGEWPDKSTLLFCPKRIRRLLITDYFMTILKYY